MKRILPYFSQSQLFVNIFNVALSCLEFILFTVAWRGHWEKWVRDYGFEEYCNTASSLLISLVLCYHLLSSFHTMHVVARRFLRISTMMAGKNSEKSPRYQMYNAK